MKIQKLGDESDGTRSIEIRSNEISFRSLIRCIRKIPGAGIVYTALDPINDNAKIILKYKDITLIIDTPFSDYIVNCSSSSPSFDEFITILRNYRVKWWERFF